MINRKTYKEAGCKCENAVVIRGNLSDGFEVIGPFDNWHLASEWATNNPSGDFEDWIVTLHNQVYCPIAK